MSLKRRVRSALRNAVPQALETPARRSLTEERRLVALRTILKAGAFDQEWYEAQTGRTFRSVETACLHYVRYGRVRGLSPHPLFEPSMAWPQSWRKGGALDPFARHLRGQRPTSGHVHPGLDHTWSAVEKGTPKWLAWARSAGPDTPVPLRWADPDAPVTWGEFRAEALARAAEVHRLRTLREQIRQSTALPAAVGEGAGPAAVASVPDVLGDSELDGSLTGGSEGDAGRPLVSVVMPTWNRAPILRAAIASVVAQTLQDWELIVVDDGSDDDTLLILEGIARHDPRIRVVPVPHGGVCRARNRGLEAARGHWVAFLDSDNAWHPDFLERIVRVADERGALWAHAALKMNTDAGVRYRAFEGTREHLLVGNHVDLNVLIARRDAVEKIGGFDESLRRAVDYDLVLRLSTLAPPTLAPFVGATYTGSRDDSQRISVAESPTWNAVVAQRHLVDVAAQRAKPRVPGRVSLVIPVRALLPEVADLVQMLRGSAPDLQIIVMVVDYADSVARGLSVAALGAPDVEVHYWPADLGWAAAVDLGATHATGEYLLAWRPNCLPMQGWWPPVRDALDDADTVIATPLTLVPDGRISSAGATFVPPDPVPSPLLANFPRDDARALGTAQVPAAYAGVVALRADDFWDLGGVDPIYGSALGEVDLSLRARAAGLGGTAVVTAAQVIARNPGIYGFGPDLSASARIMRRNHSDPPSSVDIWKRLDFEVIGRRVAALPALRGTPVELGAAPVVRPIVHEHPRRLRWALDIAAPAGPRGLLWGDLHFANSLADSLRRLGQQVHVDFREARNVEHRDLDDVTLVLRGLDEVVPRPGGVSLMWIISHPDLVTEPECAAYAQVFAASTHWADMVSTRWGFPVHPLLQCTDATLFGPDAAEPDSGPDVLFVGNSRRVQRLSVKYALDAGMEPVVYGGGWEGVIPEERIAGEFVTNADLPALYAAAGVVLCDHWDDMRHEGFISNRVFDVLATGGRLLSDHVVGLPELLGPGYPVFQSEVDVKNVFAGDWRTSWPDRATRLELAEKVRTEHSFDARAATLLEVAMDEVARHGGGS